MLLTYGNIKKSKFLKYIYLSDYNDDEYRKALLEYNKSIIKNFEKSDFIKIYKYLHDAKIYLKQINGNVVIKETSVPRSVIEYVSAGKVVLLYNDEILAEY